MSITFPPVANLSAALWRIGSNALWPVDPNAPRRKTVAAPLVYRDDEPRPQSPRSVYFGVDLRSSEMTRRYLWNNVTKCIIRELLPDEDFPPAGIGDHVGLLELKDNETVKRYTSRDGITYVSGELKKDVSSEPERYAMKIDRNPPVSGHDMMRMHREMYMPKLEPLVFDGPTDGQPYVFKRSPPAIGSYANGLITVTLVTELGDVVYKLNYIELTPDTCREAANFFNQLAEYLVDVNRE